MTATIKGIANQLGLDPSTVSRALNGSNQISKTTRVKVLETAQKLNYIPNIWAQNLVGSASSIIGCLVLEFDNPFYSPMVRAITDLAEKDNYIVFLCESRRQLEIEKQVLDRFRRIRVEGIIITPVLSETEHLRVFADDIPVVFAGREASGFDSININNEKSGYLVGSYLCNLGHNNIAYISSGEVYNIPEQKRLKGLTLALQEVGIKLSAYYEVGNNRFQGGEKAALQWLEDDPRPSAVFCANDLLAMGFIQKVTHFGFSIPRDVSVIGHDDIPFADAFMSGLTTVAVPKYALGNIAAKLLFQKMQLREDLQAIPELQTILLEPELIERSSCKAL